MLFENNREYQSLKQTYKSQQISLKIAKEAYLPAISGSYSYSKSDDWSTPSSNQVGIRASIDLFNGFNKSKPEAKPDSFRNSFRDNIFDFLFLLLLTKLYFSNG